MEWIRHAVFSSAQHMVEGIMTTKAQAVAAHNGTADKHVLPKRYFCMCPGCPVKKDRDGNRKLVSEAHFKNGKCKGTTEGS